MSTKSPMNPTMIALPASGVLAAPDALMSAAPWVISSRQSVSELQKDDGINFIVTGFGDMLLGMPDALSGAGFDVPAISQAGTPLNRQLIADGTMQVADVALPTSFLGWRAVDAGLRAIAGQDSGTFTQPPYADFDGHPDIAISGVPQRVIEADDIDDPTVPWVGVEGYQDAFSALWGR